MSVDQPSQSILSAESQVVEDRDAQTMNIAAGKAVGELVRTTLGPRGMDKLLVDDAGMGIVTNDGASIVREMDIEHPAANLVATVAKKQEETVGDGTTTAVATASVLLENAEDLLERGLHPTLIAEGYALALSAAREELRAASFGVDEQSGLESVVRTAMSGAGPGTGRETLVDVTASAARAAQTNDNDPTAFTEIAKDVGGDVAGTWLMDGVVLKKERAHPGMPPLVEDPAVAVLDGPVTAETDDDERSVTLSDPERLDRLRETDRERLDEQVDALLDLGVDAVICEKDVDAYAQERLARAGVYAARRQRPDDVEKAARATDATIQHSVDALSPADLGTCGTVAERNVGGEPQTSIEGVPRENAATIVLRGGTRNVVDEIHRTVEDALNTAGAALEDGSVVAGGGGAEALAAARIRDRATSVDDRIQFAVTAFADALETVPRTLAENSGRNPVDSLTELRHAYHRGDDAAAIDADTGAVVDARERGIVDPIDVKVSALESATQVATMLLRIDDVVAADRLAGGDVTVDTEPQTEE